jgi:O-antigen ligase
MSNKKHKKQNLSPNPQKNNSINSVGIESNKDNSFRYLTQQPPVGKWYIYAIGFLLFLPVTIAPLWTKYGYSPDLHMAWIIQFGTTLLITLFCFKHVRVKHFAWTPSPLMYAVVGFYLWALISVIWAYNRFESMISLLDWGAGTLMFLLVLNALRKAEQVRVLVMAIFFTGICMSVLGMFQYLFDVQWVQQHAKPSATFNNKNMAAQYTLMSIGLGMGLFWTAKNRIETWLYAIGTAFVVLFVHYTITRGANFATLGIFLFMAVFILIDRLFNKKKGPMDKEKWQAAGVAFIIFIVLGMFTSEGFVGTKAFEVHFNEGSKLLTNEFNLDTRERGTRLDMWANSTAMIKDNPIIGVGMGNWMVYYPYYQTAVSIDHEMSEAIQHINAHNDYVEIFSDLGIIGFLLLLSIFIVASYLALSNFYKNRDNPNRYLLLGVLLAATGISINAIGSFPFKQPAPILMTCVYLAIIANEYARWKNSRLVKINSKPFALVLGFIFLFVTTGTFALHYQWNQSEIHFRLATIASHQQKYFNMLREGKKSHEALPLRDRMLNFVGMGYLRTGNVSKAAEYLELVKKSYPHRNNTLQNLGYIYLQLAEQARKTKDYTTYKAMLDKAEENFAHFVKIRPDNPRTRRNLGITFYRQSFVLQGKQQADSLLQAAYQLKKAIEINPKMSDRASLINFANNLETRASVINKALAAQTEATPSTKQ